MSDALATTEYTIFDAVTGEVLCHTASSTKRLMSSARERLVRAAFFAMLDRAGMWQDTGDGSRFVRDSFSTAWLAADMLTAEDTGSDLFNLCHDIADEMGGPLCPCNALSGEARANRRVGTARHTDAVSMVVSDPREAWLTVWRDTLATGTKARRAGLVPVSKAQQAANLARYM